MPDVKIGGKIIKRQTSIKSLGVMLDENLSWKDLIKIIESNYVRNWLDKDSKKSLGLFHEMIKNSKT